MVLPLWFGGIVSVLLFACTVHSGFWFVRLFSKKAVNVNELKQENEKYTEDWTCEWGLVMHQRSCSCWKHSLLSFVQQMNELNEETKGGWRIVLFGKHCTALHLFCYVRMSFCSRALFCKQFCHKEPRPKFKTEKETQKWTECVCYETCVHLSKHEHSHVSPLSVNCFGGLFPKATSGSQGSYRWLHFGMPLQGARHLDNFSFFFQE